MVNSPKYLEGYEIGRRWTDTYRPGGPYVHRLLGGEPPAIRAICEQSAKDHADWRAGFDAGLSEQST